MTDSAPTPPSAEPTPSAPPTVPAAAGPDTGRTVPPQAAGPGSAHPSAPPPAAGHGPGHPAAPPAGPGPGQWAAPAPSTVGPGAGRPAPAPAGEPGTGAWAGQWTVPPTAVGQPRPQLPATPPAPSALRRRWPGPAGGAQPVVLGAVTVAAAVAASVVPFDRPGAGWLLASLAGAGALGTAAAVRPRVTPSGPPAAPDAPAAESNGPKPPTGAPKAPDRPNAEPSTQQASTGEPTASDTPVSGPIPAGAPTTGGDARTRSAPAAAGGGPADADTRPGATGAPGRVVRVAWAAATIALVAVGSVRAAGWLFVLCVLAAAVTASLALTGGRTPLGILVSAVLPPAAAARALPWGARGLSASRPNAPGFGRTLASVAVSIGLLALFGILFSSADAIFADLVTDLLPDISAPGVTSWTLRWLLIGAGLLGGAYLLTRPPDLDGLRGAPARTVRRLDWALPLATLDALFAAFVLVQLTVLFGGSGHVLRTAGLSYAQYARSGFWQLLAVSALTLLVIGGAVRWAPHGSRADRVLIRALLGTLTLLSLVVVASALYRMQVYTEAYGATRLRLFVATVELWLGVLFVLVGVTVLRLRGAWLPRLVVATAVIALLGLAAVNPDRTIAERNVDRYRATGRLDVGYLAGLSADAVPALDRLPEPLRSCALRSIAADLPEDGLRAANLGRARARALLGTDPVDPGATCPYPARW
ncbi:DUF4153 domain-containing protein [Micromonospora sp. WMMD812]|uniref:DUF4153 domain-containing protein n=1 Tax=Micromonospora sp. WMMD812 TaxID=3015152 RepID=UPI00248CDFED|nr:DUF4153 domain-containing protein [Micromonospora sp. WMMD812]WBB65866.1 DUF4173 domain-containing protein [Micromonospora sp. WMMD812]